MKGTARLTVEDSGSGVPPEQYAIIQSPFQKAGDGQKQGSGSGLAIGKRIAELHGSEINIEKSSLGGLAVTTLLPLAHR